MATLGTVSSGGRPHLVPIVYALEGDRLLTAVDHKPKRTRDLARLANIEREPRVTVLVQHYDEDWTQLWWCGLEGQARVVAAGPELAAAAAALAARYEQYRDVPIRGPGIVIDVTAWRGWRA